MCAQLEVIIHLVLESWLQAQARLLIQVDFTRLRTHTPA